MKTQILVVDDEKDIADLVELYLTNENYEIHKFYDSLLAIDYTEHHSIDLAILDLMMPGLDGMAFCERLRKQYTFPVIMLTAKDAEIDKVKGFTAGADDYITKPFAPMEMVARVKAALRRYTSYNGSTKDDHIISIDGLMLDTNRHICLLNEVVIHFTPKEFSILQLLCEHRGNVLKPDTIFERVWGDAYFTSSNNTVMVHIRHIREKMKDTSENPKYIKTVWGVGYKIGN